MSISSALCAETVNSLGAEAIKEMKKLKKKELYSITANLIQSGTIEECINIVKKKFTGWTE